MDHCVRLRCYVYQKLPLEYSDLLDVSIRRIIFPSGVCTILKALILPPRGIVNSVIFPLIRRSYFLRSSELGTNFGSPASAIVLSQDFEPHKYAYQAEGEIPHLLFCFHIFPFTERRADAPGDEIRDTKCPLISAA